MQSLVIFALLVAASLALSALANGAKPDQFGIGQGAASVTVPQ